MNKKLFNIIALFSVFILVLTGCSQQGKFGKPFKHKTRRNEIRRVLWKTKTIE